MHLTPEQTRKAFKVTSDIFYGMNYQLSVNESMEKPPSKKT